MRITGGKARGRVIQSPLSKDVRPTASKTRQALFNILSNKVQEADVLEIFAGTGLIGMEALSRGASSLTAIEHSRSLANNIRETAVGLGYQANVLACDFRSALKSIKKQKFDIVFADPPYKTNHAQTILSLLDELDLLKDDAIVIIEHMKGTLREDDELCLKRTDYRQYGISSLSFFKKAIQE